MVEFSSVPNVNALMKKLITVFITDHDISHVLSAKKNVIPNV